MRYLAELKPFLRRMRELVAEKIRPILREMVARHAEATGQRKDAMAPGHRIQNELRRVSERMTKEWPNERLRGLSSEIANATSRWQKDQLFAQVKGALGLDIGTMLDKGIGARLAMFNAENVSLIRSIQTRYLSEVEKIVLIGISNGSRASDIAADLVERAEVSEANAARIARDQVGKLVGQLNAVRQQQLGITGFTWRTVHDQRVREEHAELDGKKFEWDDPPDEGLPGEPINCRCWAEPNFEGLLETE
jgi:SPP1 gp7 family putative phage head morphogenesis protein